MTRSNITYTFSKKATINVFTNDCTLDVIAIPDGMTLDDIKDELNKLYPNGYKSVTLGTTIGIFYKGLRKRNFEANSNK